MGKLFIVPTPIGNLDDITIRAVKVLEHVDLILVEDTRVSSYLLKHLGINKSIQPYHKFNEHKTTGNINQRILGGENIAIISDAGTPSISDPGFYLVRSCIESGIEVECLPGATAFVPALVNSGIPSDKFCFEGFLPQKKGRQKRLKVLATEERTLIFYESPYRLMKALEEFITYFGEQRRASVSRELTKIHEENVRGTLNELKDYFSKSVIKGEIVIVIEGFNKKGSHEVSANIEESDDNE